MSWLTSTYSEEEGGGRGGSAVFEPCSTYPICNIIKFPCHVNSAERKIYSAISYGTTQLLFTFLAEPIQSK